MVCLRNTDISILYNGDDDDDDENNNNKIPYNGNSAHMECENKSDTSNYRSNWKHLKITQAVPEKHAGKTRNQGTTKHSHTGQCTHTAESANI